MAALIMWEVTGSSLTVAMSIEEISGSKDIAATTKSSGCFWCVSIRQLHIQSNWLKGTFTAATGAKNHRHESRTDEDVFAHVFSIKTSTHSPT